MGIVLAAQSEPVPLVRDTTARAADAAVNLVPIWSCVGWGTCRVYVESDVAGTLSIWQKERNGTFRQTNSQAIAAATGTPVEATIVGERIRIRYVNGSTIQARFACYASLMP